MAGEMEKEMRLIYTFKPKITNIGRTRTKTVDRL